MWQLSFSCRCAAFLNFRNALAAPAKQGEIVLHNASLSPKTDGRGLLEPLLLNITDQGIAYRRR
jgi:hypothetical protein